MSKILSKEDIYEEKNEEPIDEIVKDIITIKSKKLKSFFDYEYLEGMDKNELKTVLIKTNILIFIDEYKFNQMNSCCGCTCKYLLKKRLLKNKIFPGCIFLSYDFKVDFQEYFMKKRNCINIYFDEGVINKNIIYKKMEIKNNILFIPIEKYKSKLIEYKLRSFCQIMEELGAKNIEIEFINKKLSEKKNNINNILKLDIITSKLGFNKHNIENNSKDIKYNLIYPNFNTIILNEDIIKKNIKEKKYIINENNYYSNLELQYIISARCNHYIEKYSTTFSIDNNILIDNKLYLKLKKYNIGNNLEYNYSNYSKNYFYIFTNITFSTKNDIIDNICSSNLNYNENGFNYLINTLSEDKFEEKGIFKIIDFIENYINNLNRENEKYKKLNKIIKIIKNECSLNEFSILLLNYFTINSQWCHFKNFIDLLLNNTISYDKIGYLMIYYNDKINYKNKIEKIIKFIYKNCFNYYGNNITKKFWSMLRYNDSNFEYYLRLKLDIEYNLLKKYNWTSIRKILHDINNYKIIEKDITNKNLIFDYLLNNINLGYSYYEFYENMIPFILKIYYEYINKNNIKELITNKYLDLIITDSFSYESFKFNNITNYNLLENYIIQKIQKIVNSYYFINDLKNKINCIDNDFKKYILNKKYMKKYKYIDKKLQLIFHDTNYLNKIDRFNIFIKKYTNFDDSKEVILKKFIKKIFIYNEKLDINNIPLDNFGFKLLKYKYLYGDEIIEIKNTIIPYLKRIIKKLIIDSTENNSYNYEIIIEKLNNLNINNFKIITTYDKILLYCKDLIKNK